MTQFQVDELDSLSTDLEAKVLLISALSFNHKPLRYCTSRHRKQMRPFDKERWIYQVCTGVLSAALHRRH